MEIELSPGSPSAVAQFRASITEFAFNEGDSISSSRLTANTPTEKRARGRDLDTFESYDPELELVVKRKKKRRVRGYADPETYAHLQELQDYLTEGLDVVFCGINPGQKSAQVGHHFAHPTNHFWACLHESGFTPTRIPPEEDHTLPERFSIGLTNLVERPTAEQNELSIDEQATGVPSLLSKISRYHPTIVCFVGLGIAKIVRNQVLTNPPAPFKLTLTTASKSTSSAAEDMPTSKPKPKPKRSKLSLQALNAHGLQPYKIVYRRPTQPTTTSSGEPRPGSEPRPSSPAVEIKTETVAETLFYALPSTSARVVSPQKTGKIALFREFKGLVERLECGEVNTDEMHVLQLESEWE